MTDQPVPHVSTLATALAKAQGEMKNAAINKENPYFNSRYADLAAIRDATIPALSKNGLCIYHSVHRDGENWYVRAVLKHGESGESIISDFPLPNLFDKPQAIGSAITYGKRYTWAALCGIAAEEDDDANAAQGNTPKQAEHKPKAKTNVIEMQQQAPALVSKTPVAILKPDDQEWSVWGKAFLEHLKQATLTKDADDWMKANGPTLDAMEKAVPRMHKNLSQAVFQVYEKLGTKNDPV